MKLLKPLSVPWMVCPSVPHLTLISQEEGRHFVKFCGIFGFEEAAPASSDSITVDSGTLTVNPREASKRYQLICLEFCLVGWIRRNPQYSSREVIRQSEYDWSFVTGNIGDHEEIEDWLQRTRRVWKETRICQNPGVYIVENSDWEVGRDRERYNLKHFLIVGDTSYLELMAQSCSWVSEGNLTR